MKKIRFVPAVFSLAMLSAGNALAVDPASIDWGSVPVTSIPLFYPGQSTYQWLRSTAHEGYKRTITGTGCFACHEDQEAKMGDAMVKANKLEPMPVKGKNGVLPLAVQVAYDQENAYFRFQWKTSNKYAGDAHPYLRFDGKEWKQYGFPKLDAVVQKGEQPGIYEDRMSMLIDDGSVPGFAKQGCWLTCHDGMRDNPKQAAAADVKANPLYKALDKNDVRKYLPSTRSDDAASWGKGKSPDEIAKIKAAGGFLDLIQWRAHRSNPVGMADDGYVLEYRKSDAGKDPFGSNVDKTTHQPKFMFDAKKFGKKSVTLDDIRKKPTVLIREQNAVPFDPNAGWKEGDLIPEYIVSREDAAGSAADNKQAKGVWKDGMWTLVMARPLNLTNADDKTLKEGKAYSIGFAAHEDNITTRGHHVSFPVTVGFGAKKATIEATKLK
ncbi:MAG: ethylbenzene dehydrogenase-related protein [Telluria sp.]|nr:ethylbenzene dehydrogenase-related protein [Telluria sp.]